MHTKLVPLAVGALALAATAQNPRSPQLVDSSGAVFDPAVASSGDLSIVAYSGDNQILISRSDGTGKGWTSPQRVDGDTTGSRKDLANGYDAIAIEGLDVYLIWNDRRGGEDVFFARSIDGGVTWLPETPLTTGAGDVPEWRIAATAGTTSDIVYVLYTAGGAVDDLFLRVSTDGGVTFGAPVFVPQSVSQGSADVDSIDLAASGSTVFVTWVDNRLGNDAVFFQRSTDAGASWLPTDRQLNTAGGVPDVTGSVVLDHDGGRVAAVWDEEPTGSGLEELRASVSVDGGVTFNGPALVGSYTPGTDDVDNGWVTVTAGGTVIAVWEDNRTGSDEIFAARSTDGGVSWSADVQLSTAGGGFPRALSGTDVAVATWTGGGFPESAEAAMTCDGGATWLAPANASTGQTGDADFAEGAYNALYDNLVSVWLSDDAGSNDVYAGGFRAATIDAVGWGTSAANVRFDLSCFGSGTAAFVGVSLGNGPLPVPNDPRVICLDADPLLLGSIGSAVFTANLSAGSGSTPAIPNPFANLNLGITVYYAAFAATPNGLVGRISDTGSFDL